MKTKVATGLARGSASDAGRTLAASVREQIGYPQIALVFGSTAQPLEALMASLTSALPETVMIGASTAGEFTEQEEASGSATIFAVSGDFHARIGIGVGLKANTERAIQDAIKDLPLSIDGHPHRTAL